MLPIDWTDSACSMMKIIGDTFSGFSGRPGHQSGTLIGLRAGSTPVPFADLNLGCSRIETIHAATTTITTATAVLEVIAENFCMSSQVSNSKIDCCEIFIAVAHRRSLDRPVLDYPASQSTWEAFSLAPTPSSPSDERQSRGVAFRNLFFAAAPYTRRPACHGLVECCRLSMKIHALSGTSDIKASIAGTPGRDEVEEPGPRSTWHMPWRSTQHDAYSDSRTARPIGANYLVDCVGSRGNCNGIHLLYRSLSWEEDTNFCDSGSPITVL